MKSIKTFTIIVFAALNINSYGQVGDCIGAFQLDNKEDFTFIFSPDENIVNDDLTPLCEGADVVFDGDAGFPSQWFTWTIEESGTLYFTLSMQLEQYDLDFILYSTSPDDNSCDGKEAIRCMYSGESAGIPSDDCIAATGLTPGEIDLFENAGCGSGSNNFLQQVDAIAGEKYYLLVIDFSNIGNEETLFEMCGTATLGPNDTPCVTSSNKDVFTSSRLSVYPNPVHDRLYLNESEQDLMGTIEIINHMGQTLMTKQINDSNVYFDTSSLNPGMYFLKIKDRMEYLKFIKA